MSWIERLVETYDHAESCIGDANDTTPLLPICHTMQNAHIEITLDDKGNFLRAKVIEKALSPTIIPCTEDSGTRTSGTEAHPLADKLIYTAEDYPDYCKKITSTGKKRAEEAYAKYVDLLGNWVKKEANPKTISVLLYVQKGTLISDLVTSGVIPVDDENKILETWKGDKESKPALYDSLGATTKPSDSFIRWAVEIPENLNSSTQHDSSLWDSWIRYFRPTLKSSLCSISGNTEFIASKHFARIRHAGDKAKLISSNDGSGFTYRGKFTDADQACSIGFDTTQKAHNALRWLIAKQGRRFGDQTIVSWSTHTKETPDFLVSTFDLIGSEAGADKQEATVDTSEAFAKRLGSYIAGYGTTIKQNETNQIVILSIDSATPGRMAIRYYRELRASEFLERVEHWHESCAWHQFFGKDKQFIGAPSPKDIAQAAYGAKLDTKNKLLSATVNRLLPCIIDGSPFPRDLVESCVRNARSPLSYEQKYRSTQHAKALGIACSLYKKYHHERNYQMTHEEDRNTRCYLYGSLLAIADHIEERALYITGERRDTNAMKLMQRFAERPFSTWRTIALQLPPYLSRLKAKRESLHTELSKKLDSTYTRIQASDFEKDTPLDGEFLLGFHTMRKALWEHSKQDKDLESTEQ